jgi:hypothetical protein
MKHILIFTSLIIAVSGCVEKEINPQDIVGKWTSTGIGQNLERDGITWSAWAKTGQVDKNRFFEFKSDSTFNYAPRSSFDSCLYGNKYATRIYKSSILIGFTDFKRPTKFDCGLIDAIPTHWIIYSVAGDTLISGTENSKTKYARIK